MRRNTFMRGIKSKFKLIWKTKIASHFVNVADSTNIGIIFLLALGHLLSGIGQFFVFPIAIGTSAISAILSVHRAYVERKKGRSAIVDAVATTTTALGIIAAIILTFVGGTALATIAPMILTGTLGLKTLYDLGASCYYWYKYVKNRKINPEKADKYFKKAKDFTIAFAATALATTAAGAVLIAHKSSFASLGIAAGAIGAGYASYAGYKAYQKYKAKSHKQSQQDDFEIVLENPGLDIHELTNNALLHSRFAYTSSVSNDSAPITELNLFSNNNRHPAYFFEMPNTHLNLATTDITGRQQNVLRFSR